MSALICARHGARPAALLLTAATATTTTASPATRPFLTARRPAAWRAGLFEARILHAGGVDALDRRELRHVDLEALGVEDLRCEAEVGHGRLVAVAVGAGCGGCPRSSPRRPRSRSRSSAATRRSPPPTARTCRADRPSPQVLDLMDVGGRDQGKRPHPRAADRVLGQSGGCRCVSSRYSRIGIDWVSTSPESSTSAGTSFCGLIATYRARGARLAQMAGGVLDRGALEVERDADANAAESGNTRSVS